MPTSPEKIESILGFAARAGKLLYGLDTLLAGGRTHTHVVLYGNDLQESAVKKLTAYAKQKKVPLIRCRRAVGDILGRAGVKVVGVIDKQMARAMTRYTSENFILIAPEVD